MNKVRFILCRIEVALSLHCKQLEKEKREKEDRDLLERARAAKDKFLEEARAGKSIHNSNYSSRSGVSVATAAGAGVASGFATASSGGNSNFNQQNSNMGSFVSRNMGSIGKGLNNSGKNKENEIIILDDDDDEDDQEMENNQNKNTTSTATKTTTSPAPATRKTNSSTDKVNSTNSTQLPQSTANNDATSTTASSSNSNSNNSSIQQFTPSTRIPPSQQYITPHKHQTRPYLQSSKFPPQGVPTSLLFLNDSKITNNNAINYTASYSIYERSRCQLTFNMAFMSCEQTVKTMRQHPIPPPTHTQFPSNFSSIYLDGHALDNFENRLRQWDPYWDVIVDCSKFDTKNPNGDIVEIGYKTTFVTESRLDRPMEDRNEEPRTASLIPLEFSKLDENNKMVKWGQKPMNLLNKSNSGYHNVEYRNGEHRLIIRTLPLIPNPKYKKKRSDTHQWPKGTFLQIQSRPIFPIHQRKQQQHDPTEWKGLSHMLDLTEYVTSNELLYRKQNKLRFNLAMCAKDSEMYGIQVAVCRHITPDELFNICMSSGAKGSIAKMDYKDGLKHAMKHFEKETLVLDSDDDDDDNNGNATKANGSSADAGSKQIQSLTCSLICPVTMQVIQTPVRGSNCKHSNCFDLRSFLHQNSKVSGGRWRCFVCEDFISLDQLVYDGFIAQVLETYKNDINTTNRDKVQLSHDGTWKLLDQASSSVKRNQKKRKIHEQNGNNAKKRPNPPVVNEIIDIDD